MYLVFPLNMNLLSWYVDELWNKPRYQVTYHMYLASERGLSYTSSVDCIVSLNNTYMKHSTGEKIPGSPRFSILQATESWVGPGTNARHHPRMSELGDLCRHQCYHTSRPSLAGESWERDYRTSVSIQLHAVVMVMHACPRMSHWRQAARGVLAAAVLHTTLQQCGWYELRLNVSFVTIRIYGMDKYTRTCE